MEMCEGSRAALIPRKLGTLSAISGGKKLSYRVHVTLGKIITWWQEGNNSGFLEISERGNHLVHSLTAVQLKLVYLLRFKLEC